LPTKHVGLAHKMDLQSTFKYFSLQQPDTLVVSDTIPQAKAISDTISAPSDINPLFIEIERKSIEIEEQKEKELKPYTAKRTNQTIKVDTTCHFCPSGKPIPLFSVIEKPQAINNRFYTENLYDKEFYKNNIGAKGPVFIETAPSATSHTETIAPKPLAVKSATPNWAIYSTIGILLALAYAKIFHSKNISSLFRSGVFYFIAGRLTQENSSLWNRFFFVLDTLFFITIPLGTSLALNRYGLIPQEYSVLNIFFIVFMLLFAFRLLRFASVKTIGIISNRPKELNQLYFNILLYTRITSIILAPLVILLAYSNPSLTHSLVVISIAIIGLSLIYRTFRTLQVFISKGFSLFYLILYLCALEIIPILLLAKAIE